jgi:hypothetical protein
MLSIHSEPTPRFKISRGARPLSLTLIFIVSLTKVPVIFILFQNPEISSKLAEFNSKSFKSEDSQKAKTNKSWKTSFWANSMEFSKPLKRSRGLVKFVSVMTTRKRISSFLHASVKAHVLSFTLNALNNGSTVKLKRKLWELSKHTTLTNSNVKSASIRIQEWL